MVKSTTSALEDDPLVRALFDMYRDTQAKASKVAARRRARELLKLLNEGDEAAIQSALASWPVDVALLQAFRRAVLNDRQSTLASGKNADLRDTARQAWSAHSASHRAALDGRPTNGPSRKEFSTDFALRLVKEHPERVAPKYKKKPEGERWVVSPEQVRRWLAGHR